MSKAMFKLNLAGLNELMKSDAMQSVLNDAATKVAAVCGDGYEAEQAHPISFVAIASVRATTFEARASNNKHNTLLKAAGSVKI